MMLSITAEKNECSANTIHYSRLHRVQRSSREGVSRNTLSLCSPLLPRAFMVTSICAYSKLKLISLDTSLEESPSASSCSELLSFFRDASRSSSSRSAFFFFFGRLSLKKWLFPHSILSPWCSWMGLETEDPLTNVLWGKEDNMNRITTLSASLL